jgi:hypothetical protein
MDRVSMAAQFRTQVREDSREKFLAEGEARAEARGRAENFSTMSPYQFELLNVRPSYESELIELGESSGASKETIEVEQAKWLKNQENKS